MLIVLVAVGHLLSKGVTERMGVAHAMYVWIYLFHMPAFIFIAGHFSRRRTLSERSVQGIVMRAIVPFVVFTVLYATATSLVTGKTLRIDLVNPYWLLWFLPALAAWKLITPVYLNLRWPLAISLVVGLGVGLIERVGADFSISRIFSLAPFFVLGAMTTPESLRRLTQPLARMAGAAVLLVSATLVVLFHGHIGSPRLPVLEQRLRQAAPQRAGGLRDPRRDVRDRRGAPARAAGGHAHPADLGRRPRRRLALHLPAARLPGARRQQRSGWSTWSPTCPD